MRCLQPCSGWSAWAQALAYSLNTWHTTSPSGPDLKRGTKRDWVWLEPRELGPQSQVGLTDPGCAAQTQNHPPAVSPSSKNLSVNPNNNKSSIDWFSWSTTKEPFRFYTYNMGATCLNMQIWLFSLPAEVVGAAGHVGQRANGVVAALKWWIQQHCTHSLHFLPP